MEIRFDGKVALVTGAASGIGYACAEQLAESGAAVALVGSRLERLQEAESKLSAKGKVKSFALDIGKTGDIAGVIGRIREELGEIDLVVQCAARVINKPSLEFSIEDWDAMIDVDAKGIFFIMQEVVKQSMKERGGSIVNMASMAGIRGMAPPLCNALYSAAKGAVVALSRQGATEWAPYGVRVNAMAPGGVSTHGRSLPEFMYPMVPLKRFCTPEEVASGVLYLLSDQAAAVTGQVMIMDGGASVQGY